MPDLTLIEVENKAKDPTDGFEVSASDLFSYGLTADATWHTHPGKTASMSLRDDLAFRAWPELTHYIIGSDGIRCYVVHETGQVIECV
jgi:hypothetical protein